MISSTLSWPGMRTHYAWLPPHAEPTRTGTGQVGVAFTAHRRLVRETAGQVVESDVAAGAVYVTGRDAITWLEVAETTEALEIYPDEALLGAVAGCEFDVIPALAVRDSVVFGIASLLRRAHVSQGALSDVAGSTLAHRLVHHLLYEYAGLRPRERGGLLSGRTVEAVSAVVEARLGEPLSLDVLADAARLSPYHFARTFKATTGMTPHTFVTVRRVERAKGLLLRPRCTVEQAAYAVGFTNVDHFRRIFRRHVGVTPGALHG